MIVLNIIQYILFIAIIYLALKNEDKSYLTKNKEECKYCEREIDSTSLNCPYCQEEIKKSCYSCGKLIFSDWRYCPFCEEKNYKDKNYMKKFKKIRILI